MTDHSELKRLAEDCKSSSGIDLMGARVKFHAAANPTAVLALIAEVEALKDSHEQIFENYNKVSYASEKRGEERDQLKSENEALRKELASLKSLAIRTDKTTIGYTGCIVCGEHTSHGGLQCPNLAARSLSMENQRIVPVEPIRVEHPLDALDRKLKL